MASNSLSGALKESEQGHFVKGPETAPQPLPSQGLGPPQPGPLDWAFSRQPQSIPGHPLWPVGVLWDSQLS